MLKSFGLGHCVWAIEFISFQTVVQREGRSSHPQSVPLYCIYPNIIRWRMSHFSFHKQDPQCRIRSSVMWICVVGQVFLDILKAHGDFILRVMQLRSSIPIIILGLFDPEMKELWYFGTSETTCPVAQCHITEDLNLQQLFVGITNLTILGLCIEKDCGYYPNTACVHCYPLWTLCPFIRNTKKCQHFLHLLHPVQNSSGRNLWHGVT